MGSGSICKKIISHNVEYGSFSCGKESIDKMVFKSYYTTILQHAHAYEVSSGNVILGYYMVTLKNILLDNISEDLADYKEMFDSCPSLYIKYIAVAEKYQKKKIGTQILRIIFKETIDILEKIPIRLIVIDSTPDNIEWYKKLGFRTFSVQETAEGNYTTWMYFDMQSEINKTLQDKYIEKELE